MSREAFAGLSGPALERTLRGVYRASLLEVGWGPDAADRLIADLLERRRQGPIDLDLVSEIRARHRTPCAHRRAP